MTAPNTQQVVKDLQAAGLSLTLTPAQALKVVPASDLTPVLRDLIRTHKAELVAWLTAANDSTVEAVANLPDSKATPAETTDPVPTTAPDPDRWCWPHSDAMTGREIDRFTERLKLFTVKGLTSNEAEVLADKLVLRDRDGDDRRLCLECRHLSGKRCGQWQQAGIGGPLVSADLVQLPQRCNGFKGAA